MSITAELMERKPKAEGLASYAELRRRVKETLLLGQQKIEQQKVQTYWNTGRLIDKHILLHEKRAEYGKHVIERLAEDMGLGKRILERCLIFFRQFPIASTWPELTWSHFRELLPILDKEIRLELAQRANDGKWSVDKLRLKIKKEIHGEKILEGEFGKEDRTPLIPRRGTLYTYRILRSKSIHAKPDELVIDLGFEIERKLSPAEARRFKEGDIVESKWDARKEDYSFSKSEKGEADLFTYKAAVERVVDGDTLRVTIDLGFDTSIRQYLRLRGINCPEIDKVSGKKAREFAGRELEKVPFIILQTTRSDKYDRYLSDIFYESAAGSRFLNNELLSRNLAVRMRG